MYKRISRLIALLLMITAVLLTASCTRPQTQVLQDGYYSAAGAEYDDYGWKEFITIYINGNRIVTVEYNAENASGFIKSWDMDYMRTMNAVDGTYPNEYARGYAEALLNRQNPSGVDVISGATHSHASFVILAEAAIANAQAGDKNVAFVDISIAD